MGLTKTKNPILDYTPEIAPAAVCIVLYSIVTVIHGYFVFRRPKFLGMLPVFIGGVMLVIGYITRLIVRNNLYSVPIYAVSTLCILLPPSLFAAAVYMVFGRLLKYLNQTDVSLVRVNWITKIFIMGDVISFMAQGAGGGLQTSTNLSTQKLGGNVALAGLSIQLAFVATFLVVMSIAHNRLLKVTNIKIIPNAKYSWKTLVYALYVGVVLILIRSVYRVIEFAQGYHGLLNSHEIYLYLLDALPMFLWMVLFCIVNPSMVIVNNSSSDMEMLRV
jgi:RTA1 like protein